MKRAALFFDIDGTVMSEYTRDIPDSAIEALNKAKENGHLLFINTGRTYCSLPPKLKKIPFDGFLCACGSYIVFHDEVIFERRLTMEQRNALFEKAQECNVEGVYEGAEDVFFTEKLSRFEPVERTRGHMEEKGLGLKRSLDQGDCAFDKMIIYTDENSDSDKYLDFISKDMDKIERGNGAYEVIIKGYTKGTAIKMILDKFELGPDDAYVFGDSGNDLPMFQAVNHAVAMGKHDAILEEFTDFVTKTVEEDGIEFALKHYGLI